jgi:hypothetical protein
MVEPPVEDFDGRLARSSPSAERSQATLHVSDHRRRLSTHPSIERRGDCTPDLSRDGAQVDSAHGMSGPLHPECSKSFWRLHGAAQKPSLLGERRRHAAFGSRSTTWRIDSTMTAQRVKDSITGMSDSRWISHDLHDREPADQLCAVSSPGMRPRDPITWS